MQLGAPELEVDVLDEVVELPELELELVEVLEPGNPDEDVEEAAQPLEDAAQPLELEVELPQPPELVLLLELAHQPLLDEEFEDELDEELLVELFCQVMFSYFI